MSRAGRPANPGIFATAAAAAAVAMTAAEALGAAGVALSGTGLLGAETARAAIEIAGVGASATELAASALLDVSGVNDFDRPSQIPMTTPTATTSMIALTSMRVRPLARLS